MEISKSILTEARLGVVNTGKQLYTFRHVTVENHPPICVTTRNETAHVVRRIHTYIVFTLLRMQIKKKQIGPDGLKCTVAFQWLEFILRFLPLNAGFAVTSEECS